MAKAENKTNATKASVKDYINAVEHDIRRQDGFAMLEMTSRITGTKPVMWGTSLVGFGQYHYKYDSGRDAFGG